MGPFCAEAQYRSYASKDERQVDFRAEMSIVLWLYNGYVPFVQDHAGRRVLPTAKARAKFYGDVSTGNMMSH